MKIRIPVAHPKLPAAGLLEPYLNEIDHNRIYSNYGPLNARFEAALAHHYGLEPSCVTTVTNCTIGLTLALMASGAPIGSYCLLPSWTFAATAHAVLMAGLRPCLLDVEDDSWSLSPANVIKCLRELDQPVGAIVPVFPFGAPSDLSIWDAFSKQQKIPVIVDAAAGMDSLMPSHSVAVVSLHATKVFTSGEGGFIISKDPTQIAAIRQRANFGFYDSREAAIPGTNGKMSEYHAAIGLASMQEWSQVRAEFAQALGFYHKYAKEMGISLQEGHGSEWVSSSCVVKLSDGDDQVAASKRLLIRGIDCRAWYGKGMHTHPAFRESICLGNLPITCRLAATTLGLPLFRGIDEQSIAEIIAALVS